jgi:predicted nucleic acid-binding protein
LNLVDANLLLNSEDSLSEHHQAPGAWWDERLSGTELVCLCSSVLNAFIRIATNSRLHQWPLTLKEACERVQSWFARFTSLKWKNPVAPH